MRPEDIAKQFGDETLARLYDEIFNKPVHVLADWILSLYSSKDIQQWKLFCHCVLEGRIRILITGNSTGNLPALKLSTTT